MRGASSGTSIGDLGTQARAPAVMHQRHAAILQEHGAINRNKTRQKGANNRNRWRKRVRQFELFAKTAQEFEPRCQAPGCRCFGVGGTPGTNTAAGKLSPSCANLGRVLDVTLKTELSSLFVWPPSAKTPENAQERHPNQKLR